MDEPVHPKLESPVPDSPGREPPGGGRGPEGAALQLTSPGLPSRKKRSVEDKICRVCGDKALAHNFDVITCESCKAFFRRNALKREEVSRW